MSLAMPIYLNGRLQSHPLRLLLQRIRLTRDNTRADDVGHAVAEISHCRIVPHVSILPYRSMTLAPVCNSQTGRKSRGVIRGTIMVTLPRGEGSGLKGEAAEVGKIEGLNGLRR